jgi:DNA-binding CsgD family transcriptional regulator
VAGYHTGKTIKDLAVELGVDRQTVSAHLRRAKVPIRRGGLDQDQADEAARLYQAGWSSGRLAKMFSISADTVLKALRSAGVSIRPRQGGPAPKTPPI